MRRSISQTGSQGKLRSQYTNAYGRCTFGVLRGIWFAVNKVGKDFLVATCLHGLSKRRKLRGDMHELFAMIGKVRNQHPTGRQRLIDAVEVRHRVVDVLKKLQSKAQINLREIGNRALDRTFEEGQRN